MGETIFQHTESHNKNPYSPKTALEIYEGFSETIGSISDEHNSNERLKVILSSQGPIIK